MKRSVLRGAVFALAIVWLLAGSFVAGRLFAGSEGAQAHAEASFASPASPEANFACHINNVAAFDNRIHLRCDETPGSGIWYFAYPTGSSSGWTANRMLAVAQTAYALGKPVWVFYDLDPDSNPPGCYANNCRLLTGVSMVN